MGYAVYEDGDRWAGYGVPAECDWPGCDVRIDRGLAYKCEGHGHWWEPDDENDDDEWQQTDGCGLFFCNVHLWETGTHAAIDPKPDSRQWIMHQLIDPSWAEWRNSRPDEVRRQQDLLGAGVTA